MHLVALQGPTSVSLYQFVLADTNSNLKAVLECLDCTKILLDKKHVSQKSLYSQLKVLLRLHFHVILIFWGG